MPKKGRSKIKSDPVGGNPVARQAIPESAELSVARKIIALLKIESRIDVSQYKTSTINRRILRQMNLQNFSELPEYLGFLKANPTAVQALAAEIFIHVTEFFRDPKSFEFLKREIFPRMSGTDFYACSTLRALFCVLLSRYLNHVQVHRGHWRWKLGHDAGGHACKKRA